MSATFETLGFEARYTVTIDPSERDGKQYAYGRNGKLIEEYDFDARWGTPMILRIGSDTGAAWIGAFAAGGLGTVRNVYATPSARHLCVIVDGLAYVIAADAPDRPAVIAANGVTGVVPVPEVPLLLLAGDTDLAGIRDEGEVWSAPRLVLDDLRILRANAEAIVCSGDIGGRMATITVTPSSGAIWGSDYR